MRFNGARAAAVVNSEVTRLTGLLSSIAGHRITVEKACAVYRGVADG